MKTPSHKARTSTALFILAIAIVCILLLVRSPLYLFLDVMLNPDPFNDRAFNREVWLDHYEDWGTMNPRGRMGKSVQELLLNSGMTRVEVKRLLGPPEIDSEDYAIQYLLGPYSGFRIDYDFLVISFDEDDRVKEVGIIGS